MIKGIMDSVIKPDTLSKCAVYFDFDNTITVADVLDDIIQRFSVDRDWVKFEKLWEKGEIGSKDCLRAQLKSIRVTKQVLIKYLSSVKIDPCTQMLFGLLKENGVAPVILSDSFSFIIRYVLQAHNIRGIPVYANAIRFQKDKIIPSFPYLNGCQWCAHCKKGQLPVFDKKGRFTIYVGDGHSDLCPAQAADFVFAKGRLLEFFREKNIPCLAFRDFKDIYDCFKRFLSGREDFLNRKKRQDIIHNRGLIPRGSGYL